MRDSTKEAIDNAKKAASMLGEQLKEEAKDLAKEVGAKTQEISAKLVKQLRDKTDAGIMECKNALKECAGNIEEAIEYLRKKGLSKAAKKADRIAAEGVIALQLSKDNEKATLVEVNSETDFVAKNEAFQELVENILELSFKRVLNDTDSLMQLTIQNQTFEEYLKQKIAIIGENIVVRRANTIVCKPNQIVGGYLHHNKKIGSIVLIECDDSKNLEKLKDLVKSLSMQVASMKPKVVSYKDINIDFVTKEKVAIIAELDKENEELKRLGKPLNRIPEYVSQLELSESVIEKKKDELLGQLKKDGKPEAVWDKILSGQIDRFIMDNTILDQRLTLLAQPYAFDDKKTVEQIISQKSKEIGDSIRVVKFISFELGEGIEKKVDNFAAEVAAQMK
ncbi:elongation factor Ts [Helicobacter muridarum]|uniref:Elongation factor Ts n=1 Tax=Helicobacter muridarum TaxID=216 RepID=A0A377PXG1_9HELI|nr:translation elongation factor Ts [Helicobacter muridarum]TLE01310.1 elongation factor Ts [Helicobacter muridarum]STQ87179.1 elongation factor Ts [Helicobacter muridarum]